MVEQRTVNARVVGSSPTCGANFKLVAPQRELPSSVGQKEPTVSETVREPTMWDTLATSVDRLGVATGGAAGFPNGMILPTSALGILGAIALS
jgi:hypothetical protein